MKPLLLAIEGVILMVGVWPLMTDTVDPRGPKGESEEHPSRCTDLV